MPPYVITTVQQVMQNLPVRLLRSSFSVLNFGVGPFNTGFMSSCEENNCCYKLSNFFTQNDKSTILSEIDVILCICAACNNTYFLLSLR